ncbi:MAG TPA: polymer-forming cytoskeletal protein, partial [Verrucomicrobiae bacterium]|nr:polymer-forming cytoskeletal protein [Verrucomicrobiae bacterium]
DLLAAGSYILHSGRLDGSARLLGREIYIDGVIEKSLSGAGFKLDISKDSLIKGNLLVFGSNLSIDGKIEGQAVIRGDTVVLSGEITKDVEIYANKLSILPRAKFAGTVTYFGPQAAEVSSTAKFESPLVYKPMILEPKGWVQVLRHLSSVLILAALIGFLIPKRLMEMSKQLISGVKGNLLYGLAFLIVVPVVVSLLFLLRAGSPSAWVLLLGYIGLGTTVWLFAQIACGAMLGRLVWKLLERKLTLPLLGLNMTVLIQTVLGTLVVWLICQIPFFGNAVLLFMAVGTLGASFKQLLSGARWSEKNLTLQSGVPLS